MDVANLHQWGCAWKSSSQKICDGRIVTAPAWTLAPRFLPTRPAMRRAANATCTLPVMDEAPMNERVRCEPPALGTGQKFK